MKNLITILALATVALTACQKTQYNHDDDVVLTSISGYLVDSIGIPRTNKAYMLLFGEIHPSNSFTPLTTVHPDSTGYFYTSLRISKAGAQLNFLEENSNQGTYMHIVPPVPSRIDAGMLKVGDTKYMQ
ncbi:MAG: hypothetical protein EOP51_09475 [Sphingobacteriales bacterium]|nr:MAG: hypothetical protein EOP51_09475 [Sphingobacteriales bacterium]